MSLDNPRRTILDELLRQETGFPGEQRMKMRKNIFPELEGDNWVGNALETSTASQQQVMCFRATILLDGHLFVIHWVCRRSSD